MTLPMARPYPHPETGIFWFRKVVPVDLRAIVGKREIKQSLGTKDPAEAKIRQAEKLAEIELQWATLRRGPTTISEREAHNIAETLHDRFIARHVDNPSRHGWNRFLGTDLREPEGKGVRFPNPNLKICEEEVTCYLKQKGLVIDEQGRTNLIGAAARAFQRASYTLDEYAVGRFPQASKPLATTSAGQANPPITHKKVSFDDLVQAWLRERSPANKTAYGWPRILSKLADFLGHDDAAKVTPDDIIRWKDAMVTEKLNTKTIRDSRLAPVRAIFQWAVDNRRILENPAARVKIETRKKAGENIRGFSDEEARKLLEAAAGADDLALRWMPTICAYSGARVSEVAQLRKQDITLVEDIWCIRFDPEAGHLKNQSSERTVPIHSALIDMGFLNFVEGLSKGPLFAQVKPDRFGNRGGNATKKISKWVRGLGITDERLLPSHSWRHRPKTQARRYGLALDQVNAITGHGARNVADSYGEFPISGLKREIEKIPRIVPVLDSIFDTEAKVRKRHPGRNH